MFERAERSGGLNSAVVGIDGLMQSTVEFKTTVDQSIAVAERLRKLGQDDRALSVARQALLLDAGNPILTGIVAAIQDDAVG